MTHHHRYFFILGSEEWNQRRSHTSVSPATVWRRSEQQDYASRGSTSPERRTPPSLSRGCDQAGKGWVYLPSLEDLDLQHRGHTFINSRLTRGARTALLTLC